MDPGWGSLGPPRQKYRPDALGGGMVLAQAHTVVPRIQAYRARAAERRKLLPRWINRRGPP